ncbi:hypothetical protein HDU92_002162 [Lobulomyces angularis]|nr:hypothetical protein HDU92_002162 [Lobulomyces angularis]
MEELDSRLLASLTITESERPDIEESGREDGIYYPPSMDTSILADFKFHKKLEKERSDHLKKTQSKQISDRALRSGWLQREIEREEKEFKKSDDEEGAEEDVDELIRELEKEEEEKFENLSLMSRESKLSHLMELSSSYSKNKLKKKKFGNLKFVSSLEFLTEIENEIPTQKIIINLFQKNIIKTKKINDQFNYLANKYVHLKFLSLNNNELDNDANQSALLKDNDKFLINEIGLPCILVYVAGELTLNLTRIDLLLEKSGSNDYDKNLEALEDFLIDLQVLNEADIDENFC